MYKLLSLLLPSLPLSPLPLRSSCSLLSLSPSHSHLLPLSSRFPHALEIGSPSDFGFVQFCQIMHCAVFSSSDLAWFHSHSVLVKLLCRGLFFHPSLTFFLFAGPHFFFCSLLACCFWWHTATVSFLRALFGNGLPHGGS